MRALKSEVVRYNEVLFLRSTKVNHMLGLDDGVGTMNTGRGDSQRGKGPDETLRLERP
jgi:hypothetical protein